MRSSSEVYSLMSMKSLTRLGTAVSPASELERDDSRAPPRGGVKCAPNEGSVLCGEFFRGERRPKRAVGDAGRLDHNLGCDVADVFNARCRSIGQRYVHDMGVAVRRSRRSADECSAKTAERDHGKFGHEKILHF